jgi:hypothetical protein
MPKTDDSQQSRRLVRRIGVLCVTVAALTSGSLFIVAGPGGASGATATSPSAAQLATEYLTALGPANAAIVKAETKLRALPLTATLAQVQAVVAPLKGKLAALEALTNGTTTAPPPPPSGSVSLASLGQPVGVLFWNPAANPNPGWGTWSSVQVDSCLVTNLNAVMTMAGRHYTGVQSAPNCGTSPYVAELTWRFGTARSFSADIGLDTTSPSTSITLGFVSVIGALAAPTGLQEIPFTANGQKVAASGPGTVPSIPVYSGVPTPVTVDVVGLHELTIIFEVNGSNPVLDFANAGFVS